MVSFLAKMTSTDVTLFSLIILIIFLLLFAFFLFGRWIIRKEASLSPYSQLPLRRATDLSYASMEKVLRYMYQFQQYDNRIFEFKRSAVCRETGRLFVNCITWYDAIKVDWNFLQNRYPGNYVSWGSLSQEQKEALKRVHLPLDKFQTDFSSPLASPRLIEAPYAFEKPGPLYVDVDKGILLGWQCVPDTEIEVLIVQKPLKSIILNY